jgi:hypothetical protein
MELLHRKSYGLGGRLESLVINRASAEAPASGWSGWKELCLGIVINSIHWYCTLRLGPNQVPSWHLAEEANCSAPAPQDATCWELPFVRLVLSN